MKLGFRKGTTHRTRECYSEVPRHPWERPGNAQVLPSPWVWSGQLHFTSSQVRPKGLEEGGEGSWKSWVLRFGDREGRPAQAMFSLFRATSPLLGGRHR